MSNSLASSPATYETDADTCWRLGAMYGHCFADKNACLTDSRFRQSTQIDNANAIDSYVFGYSAKTRLWHHYREAKTPLPVQVGVVLSPTESVDRMKYFSDVGVKIDDELSALRMLVSSLMANSLLATSRGESTKPLTLCDDFSTVTSPAITISERLDSLVKFLTRNNSTEPPSATISPTPTVSVGGQWEQKFIKMQQLSRGWNGYDAEPPEENAIQAARRFVSAMLTRDLTPSRVAPSVVGGVGVTTKVGSRRVYVEFYNGGSIHALLDNGDQVDTAPVTDMANGFAKFIERMKVYFDA